MHVGFILTKTPSEQGFDTFLKFIDIYQNNQITVYLVGNGVYCARKNHIAFERIKKLINDVIIYASSDDLKARGIQTKHLMEGVLTVDNYDKIVVDIMENFDQILSF